MTKSNRKLGLSVETIRELTDQSLTRFAAGFALTGTETQEPVQCPTVVAACPTVNVACPSNPVLGCVTTVLSMDVCLTEQPRCF